MSMIAVPHQTTKDSCDVFADLKYVASATTDCGVDDDLESYQHEILLEGRMLPHQHCHLLHPHLPPPPLRWLPCDLEQLEHVACYCDEEGHLDKVVALDPKIENVHNLNGSKSFDFFCVKHIKPGC